MANPGDKVMCFKHEDEDRGMPIGPCTVAVLNERGFPVGEGQDDGVLGRPFDPNRKPEPWLTLDQARTHAASQGLELYEV